MPGEHTVFVKWRGQVKKNENQTCKEVGHKAEDCPRDPNVRTGHDGKKEMERIKGIKECKKIINDTIDQTVNLLTLALKNNKSQGNILSQSALMFSDFNYKPFNGKLLVEQEEEESIEGKAKNADDSAADSKSEPASAKNETAQQRAQLDSTHMSLPRDQIDEILAAQQQDELADLIPLKICVQSDNYGTNVGLAFDGFSMSF